MFRGYDDIFDVIVSRFGMYVLEFGSGMGNLIVKLLEVGKFVFGIELFFVMCKLVFDKFLGRVEIVDGDFLIFFEFLFYVDIIVSLYVFYYLIDEEKWVVIK